MPRSLPVPATPDEWRAVAALIDRYGHQPSTACKRLTGRDVRLGNRTPRDVLRNLGGLGTVLAAFAAEAAELGLVDRSADVGSGTAAGIGPRLAARAEDDADDPIVAEVRAAREALFAAAGYDLEELFRQLRARRAEHEAAGFVYAAPPPRAAPSRGSEVVSS